MGHTLKELGYKSGLVPPKPYVAVKAPVFSFAKMTDVDIALGPEMKSTGEVMGIDYHYARALYKAIIGSGIHVPTKGCILFTVADKDKEEMKQLAKAFAELGFEIWPRPSSRWASMQKSSARSTSAAPTSSR